MWSMINRELAKIEEARGGAPDTSYGGVLKEALRYGEENRQWQERKNLQMQKMMEMQVEG
jgi:hypothetical protein